MNHDSRQPGNIGVNATATDSNGDPSSSSMSGYDLKGMLTRH